MKRRTLLWIVGVVLALVIASTAVVIGRSQLHSSGDSNLLVFSRSAPKYLVLFVLDGGRPDYLHMTSLPHIDALMRHGVEYTNAIDGILESETPAGHATISTGSTPARDGLLGFDWPVRGKDYTVFSEAVLNKGGFDRILERSHVPTIAGLYKEKFPDATAVALSAEKYYAAAPLGGPSADAIMYYVGTPDGKYKPVAVPGHEPPPEVLQAPGLLGPTIHLKPGQDNHYADLLAVSAFTHMHEAITLINLPEFDYPLGHIYGGPADPSLVKTDMRAFDRDVGMIEDVYRRAGVLDKTLFVFTSDHGIDSTPRRIPDSVIKQAVTKAKTTAPSIAFSTASYVWLANPAQAKTVARYIAAAHSRGIQSVYALATNGRRPAYVRVSGHFVSPTVEKANQYLLNTLMNGHEPNVVAFARNGYTFSAPSSRWIGDHGGNGWQSQHIPLILAGPGIRQGVVSREPVQLDDVAPTILTAMGVKPTGMQGHVLTEALTASTSAQRMARAREERALRPLVAALAAQNQAEGAH